MATTLYVRNLPHGVQADDLAGLFQSVGTVLDARLGTERTWGTSCRCGIVVMDDPAAARRAQHLLNGHRLAGTALRVRRHMPAPGKVRSNRLH